MTQQKSGSETHELLLKVKNIGYTPGARDIDQLCSMMGEVEAKDAELIARALLRAGGASIGSVVRHLSSSVRPARARLTELAGKLLERHEDPVLRALIFSLLNDHDFKARLNAITALGRLPGQESEEALLRQLSVPGQRDEIKKAALRSLAKVGREDAQRQIKAISGDNYQGLAAKAQLIIHREIKRQRGGSILGAVNLPSGTPVWLWCRRGLEDLVASEAREKGWLDARKVEDGIVQISHDGPLDKLWVCRLIINFSLPVPSSGGSVKALAETLGSAPVLSLLPMLTEGPVRYRLQLPKLTNAEIWQAVKIMSESVPNFVNDPRDSLWELGQCQMGGRWYLDLRPKALDDPRFTYRLADVPAASHPSIAAALARLAEPRTDDTVWDPFVGSGSELIECWKFGSPRRLCGTDIDANAVAASVLNIEAAGCRGVTEILQADSLEFSPPSPTLIISNPPMGRRVHRGTLQVLFQKLLPKLASELAPGGRLVWLTPLPALTRQVLSGLGLKLAYARAVDLGGFDAEMQRWEK
jgi:precorrin-6B methylase 2